MIRHIVLTCFKPEASDAKIAEIYDGLSDLTDTLQGARGFVGGRSDSPEHLERGYQHGFVIDFDTWENLKTYADHPRHKELGGELVAHAVGGRDGILVLDIEV